MFQSGNLLSGEMSVLVGLNGNVKLEWRKPANHGLSELPVRAMSSAWQGFLRNFQFVIPVWME